MERSIYLIIFILSSVGLVVISWEPLHDRHSHGFYRFFAWEFILALILLNIGYWFNDPFSLAQIVSWLLLAVSLYLVIREVGLLLSVGKPEGQIENTTNLVVVGIYKYIRHPLYASLLFLNWGAFFKKLSIPGLILALAGSLFLTLTAKSEEKENIEKFGLEYMEYMKSSKRFIPFLFVI